MSGFSWTTTTTTIGRRRHSSLKCSSQALELAKRRLAFTTSPTTSPPAGLLQVSALLMSHKGACYKSCYSFPAALVSHLARRHNPNGAQARNRAPLFKSVFAADEDRGNPHFIFGEITPISAAAEHKRKNQYNRKATVIQPKRATAREPSLIPRNPLMPRRLHFALSSFFTTTTTIVNVAFSPARPRVQSHQAHDNHSSPIGVHEQQQQQHRQHRQLLFSLPIECDSRSSRRRCHCQLGSFQDGHRSNSR